MSPYAAAWVGRARSALTRTASGTLRARSVRACGAAQLQGAQPRRSRLPHVIDHNRLRRCARHRCGGHHRPRATVSGVPATCSSVCVCALRLARCRAGSADPAYDKRRRASSAACREVRGVESSRVCDGQAVGPLTTRLYRHRHTASTLAVTAGFPVASVREGVRSAIEQHTQEPHGRRHSLAVLRACAAVTPCNRNASRRARRAWSPGQRRTRCSPAGTKSNTELGSSNTL